MLLSENIGENLSIDTLLLTYLFEFTEQLGFQKRAILRWYADYILMV
jgi:hypothetical protein